MEERGLGEISSGRRRGSVSWAFQHARTLGAPWIDIREDYITVGKNKLLIEDDCSDVYRSHYYLELSLAYIIFEIVIFCSQ